MQPPFPGMDPYLEAPGIWPDVHASLAFAIRDQLQPLLAPRYTAVLTPYVAFEAVEIGMVRFSVPDVAVLEGDVQATTGATAALAPAPLIGMLPMDVPTRYQRVEIRTVGDEMLVTAIEILSPVNKRPGHDGADVYDRKRREILHSDVHLLEIDLLRGGRRPAFTTPLPDRPYFIFLSRAERRPQVEIWPIRLQDPLPAVAVPLREEDPDVGLDLTAALKRVYASARYDLRIDYQQAPPPPELSPEDAAWVDRTLHEAGLR